MTQELQINPDRPDLDETYLQMAELWAKQSKANRLRVGALIVSEKRIISDGYNGMPSGWDDDVCEYIDEHGDIRSKPEVLHAESNALLKISKQGGKGAEGATLYTTHSPCAECAKLICQSKISRVVFRNLYRTTHGLEILRRLQIEVLELPKK
jgi:dCMP deaminase